MINGITQPKPPDHRRQQIWTGIADTPETHRDLLAAPTARNIKALWSGVAISERYTEPAQSTGRESLTEATQHDHDSGKSPIGFIPAPLNRQSAHRISARVNQAELFSPRVTKAIMNPRIQRCRWNIMTPLCIFRG